MVFFYVYVVCNRFWVKKVLGFVVEYVYLYIYNIKMYILLLFIYLFNARRQFKDKHNNKEILLFLKIRFRNFIFLKSYKKKFVNKQRKYSERKKS